MTINKSILIPVILLFVTTASISSLLFYNTHREGIDSQVALYQDMVLQNAILKLENFMEKPHLMNASMENILKNNPDLYDDLPRMRINIINYLKIYTSIMAGGLGIEDSGNFIAAGRYINGGFDSAIHQKEISPAYYYHKLDENGLPDELLSERESYDVKARSWYKKAVESGKASWSAIYTFAGSSGIGLTAVLPIYQKTQFKGVLQSAFSLSFINEFLNDLPMEGNHRIFIYDEAGFLIGASGESEIVLKDDNDKLQRVGLDYIDDPIIYAAQNSGALNLSSEKSETVPFLVDKDKYYLKTLSFSGNYDLDWTIAIADIRKDFTAELNTVLQKNMIISVMAAIMLLIFGIMILRLLIQPIQTLSKAVTRFSEDNNIIDLSVEGPEELQELSKGVNLMSVQINMMMKNLNEELEESNVKIETLNGLLPICANC